MQRFLLLCFVFILAGCSSTFNGRRNVINNITPGAISTIAVASLDPRKQNDFQYQAIEATFKANLNAIGVRTSLQQNEYPDAVFLIGYALDPGLSADWERTISIIGYDFKSGKMLYRMRYNSEGSSNDIILFSRSVIKDAVDRSKNIGFDSSDFKLEIIK